MMDDLLSPRERITKARIQLQNQLPFFAYFSMYLKPREDSTQPTLAVDIEGNLYYNPQFVKGLSNRQLQFAICHEILHLALHHLQRFKGKDPNIANIACDIKVNRILQDSFPDVYIKGIIFPEGDSISFFGGLIKVEKISEKSAEEIYEEIIKQLPKRGGGGGSGRGGIEGKNKNGRGRGDNKGNRKGEGDGSGSKEKSDGQNRSGSEGDGLEDYEWDRHIWSDGSGEGEDEAKGADIEEKWSRVFREAYNYAKQQGKVPAGIERIHEELYSSKLPWHKLLAQFVQKGVQASDYTWMKPSKKSLATGVYLPGIVREDKLEVVVAIDTSGSMSNEELTLALSEIISIIKAFNNLELTVIYADCAIQKVKTWTCPTPQQIIREAPKGGGGTDHVVVFEYIKKNIKMPKVIICFTDGWTTYPKSWNKCPVIWVLTDKSPSNLPPFGRTIFIRR